MAKRTKKNSDPSTIRKLKSTLTALSFVPPVLSFAEGESYVCSSCRLPVRRCNLNPDVRCTNMLLAGTELQLLRQVGKSQSIACIRCGNAIPKKVLAKNPLAELCPGCQRALSKSKLTKRMKGVSQ